MAGISLDLTSNVTDVIKGAKKTEDALGDVAGSLDELGRSAGKNVNVLSAYFDQSAIDARQSVDKMDNSFKDFAKSTPKVVDTATEKMERSFKELADATKRETKDAGDTLGKNYKRGTETAGEGLREFKDEANSTARESAASFDGSAESIVDSFQEIAANAFAGFGPAAAVAGLAAAAGIGVVGNALDINGQKAQEMADQTGDAFDEMIEAGGRYLSTEVENQKIRDTLKDPERYKDILSITKITGIAEDEVTRAIALNGEERTKVLDKLKETKPLLENISQSEAEAYALGQMKSVEIDKQVAKLDDLNKIQGTAVDLAKLYDAATGGAAAARSAERDAVQDRNRALANTPSTVPTKLTVDDSELRRALTQKSIDVVINAVTKFGSSKP